jgi:hypothetical protein
VLFGIIFMVALIGCATQARFIQLKQPTASETVLNRAKFEMNCPEATAILISKEVIQPALQGSFVGGIQRAEYTIGPAGCGKRHASVVICSDRGEDCYAAGPGRFHSDY